MLVALRSPGPSRKADLFVSVLTSRIAGNVTRTSGGVGGALRDGRPYPDQQDYFSLIDSANSSVIFFSFGIRFCILLCEIIIDF